MCSSATISAWPALRRSAMLSATACCAAVRCGPGIGGGTSRMWHNAVDCRETTARSVSNPCAVVRPGLITKALLLWVDGDVIFE
eukprot:scaffold54565_cov26-Tisochrysis_lutea.AAC.3